MRGKISLEAYMSPEFRAFALRWLGFDPHEHKTQRIIACRVSFDFGGLLEYTLARFAEEAGE